MAAGKKPGPNDKCPCGSGAKAKKCCDSPKAQGGQAAQGGSSPVLPGSVDELQNMAKAAQEGGDLVKAEHLFTMAVNAAAKGMKRNQDGIAADADLVACEKATEGKLSAVLAARAAVYLRQGKTSAAIEDADTCVRAAPRCEEGYRLLIQAFEGMGAPLQRTLEACERGLAACPESEYLVKAKWRLKKAIAERGPGSDKDEDSSATDAQTAVQETRRAADDPADPHHVTAAADWGSILATGAHGIEKDVVKAERYLRIGANGGDMIAQRNLGLLLLEEGSPVEASAELQRAAKAGDEQASELLRYLAHEAEVKRKEAMEKLEELAASGDPRARAMLEELQSQAA